MSLYNLLHGVNPLGGELLKLIDKEATPGDFGRFRDIYLEKKDDKLVVVVFTRNGGGNRDGYEDVFERWRAHPRFLRDWDDSFDCTYASLSFSISKEDEAIAEFMYEATADKRDPMQKFADLIDKLGKNKDDPEVKAATEKMRPVIEQIKGALSDGGPNVIKI